jgi:phage gp16-like protein
MVCAYQRFIQMARRRLGLDDETYRNLLESYTRKRSTKEMSPEERRRVVEALKAKGAHFGGKTARRGQDAAKASDPQSRLARHLWLRLKGYGVLRDASEWALLAYVERLTGKKRFEWCNRAETSKVIDALKAWVERIETAGAA